MCKPLPELTQKSLEQSAAEATAQDSVVLFGRGCHGVGG